jgi:hypothetical protein
MRAVWKTLVVEDESMREGHRIVDDDQKESSVRT